MPEKPITLIPFHITDADGNITDGSDGTTGTWCDVWKYQVPQGTGIILQAGDQFSCKLFDSPGVECGAAEGYADCYVKIEVRDPSEQDKRLAFGPSLYKRVREFQDRNDIAKLLLAKPLKVYPRQWIVIVANDTGTVDVSECYFNLLTSKAAASL